MKKRIIVLMALGLFAVNSIQAQYSETNNLLYNAFRMPQSNQLNAAFFPNKNSFYLQLPEMNMIFGSPLALRDVAHTQGDSITVIDINGMLNALENNNSFRIGADVGLIGFGFKAGHMFFNVNTRLRNIVSVGLPISTISALRYGNVDENGNAINEVELMDGSLLNAQSYLEMSIGGGYRFENLGLTVGGHAKMLYGIANVQTENTRAVINTADNFDNMTVDVYYQAQAGLAIPIDTNGNAEVNIGDLLNVFDANKGFAFDLGARYEMGPFSFSFAINDLSAGIHWHKNVHTYTPEGGHATLEFQGGELTGVLNGGQMSTDTLTAQVQAFINGLKPVKDNEIDYWSPVPTSIYLGANYNFAKMFRAGLLFHGQLDRGLLCKKNDYNVNMDNIKNTFRFNSTLSLGMNLFNWAELLVASSVVYDGNKADFFNPGVGLVFTPGTMLQIYVIGDYVSSFNVMDAKAFNIRMGLNLLFGKGGTTLIQN